MSTSHECEQTDNLSSPIIGGVLPVLSQFGSGKSLSENYLLKNCSSDKRAPDTKIACTLGPSSSAPETIRALIDCGMSVARINLSHGSLEENAALAERLAGVLKEKQRFCALMVDTRGNSIRLGNVKNGFVEVAKGNKIELTAKTSCGQMCDESKLFVEDKNIVQLLRASDVVTIGYGEVKLEVVEIKGESAVCTILNKGKIFGRKTVYLPPGRKNYGGALNPQAEKEIAFAVKHGAQFLSASYVAEAEQIRAVRKILADLGAESMKVIAKIGCEQALLNFDAILRESDGIFVSRGNLGEEIDLETVTLAQKLIIRKCNSEGKTVITATQMLESMCANPFPTRAEVSDVGNAIFDGTDVVMLCGETAIGVFPVEAAKMMRAVCKESERSVNNKAMFSAICDHVQKVCKEIPIEESVSSSAVKMSFNIKSSFIVVFCRDGSTAKLVSKYRPKCPIILVTDCEKSAKQALLLRGVTPLLVNTLTNDDSQVTKAFEAAKQLHFARVGDLAVVVKAKPLTRDSQAEINMVSVVPIRF